MVFLSGDSEIEMLQPVSAQETHVWTNEEPWIEYACSGSVSAFVLMICLVFFAFTTILGWDYYSERCVEYLFGGKEAPVKVFRYLYVLAVFIGPFMTVEAVWTIADIFNGLMAFPNLVALVALGSLVGRETKAYFEKSSLEKAAAKR